jgi:hypothetical protein
MLLLTMKRQDFVKFLLFENVLNIVWSGTGTGAGTRTGTGAGARTKTIPNSEPEPQQIITVPLHNTDEE